MSRLSRKLRIGLAGGVAALAIGVPVAYAVTDSPADHYFNIQAAVQLNAQGQYAQAADAYAHLTADDPSNGALWVSEAKAYLNAGNAQAAIDAYKQADALGFTQSFDSYNVARLYASLGQQSNVFKWLQRALDQRYDGRTNWITDPAFRAYVANSTFLKLAGQPAQPATTRTQGWRNDLDLVKTEAQRLHASPDRPAYSKSWLHDWQQVRDNISHSTDEQMYMGVRRLIAALHDGHSHAFNPNFDYHFGQAELWKFPDGIYVIDGGGDANNAIGARVLRIGTKDVDWLFEKSKAYHSVDNDPMYSLAVGTFLLDTSILHTLGAIPRTDVATISVRIRDTRGVVRDIDMPTTTDFPGEKLIPSKIADPSEPTPTYLSDPFNNYWTQTLPGLNAVYFEWNQVFNKFGGGQPNLQTFCNQVLATLNTNGSKYLIVDVRNNNGGNGELARHVVRLMAAFEMQDPSHRTFVITSRNTFSAAEIFIARAEQFTNAIFVGEPSSSSPNFTGEDGNRFTLPYSKMILNISFRQHQNTVSDTDRRPYIPVAVPAPLTADDYFHNRDPSMAAITDVINRLP